MGVLFVYMSMNHLSAWYPKKGRRENNTGTSGTGVRDGFELPCRYWVLNLGPAGHIYLEPLSSLC